MNEEITNMEFLIAAYSAVWLVIALYLFILVKRNRRLSTEVDYLETRVTELEDRLEKSR